MTAGVYRCPRCNAPISHDYALRILVCTKCKALLRGFQGK